MNIPGSKGDQTEGSDIGIGRKTSWRPLLLELFVAFFTLRYLLLHGEKLLCLRQSMSANVFMSSSSIAWTSQSWASTGTAGYQD